MYLFILHTTILITIFMTTPFQYATAELGALDLKNLRVNTPGPTPIPTPPPEKKSDIKNLPPVKDKDGNFQVSWKIFTEYDITDKKIGHNLRKVIGQNVSIKGYMIPLDYSARVIKDFLLVPYIPSCIHVPPPPPNMIIKVKTSSKDGQKAGYFPIKVTGKLSLVEPKGKIDRYTMDGLFFLNASTIEEIKN